jgi:hypothetical protein
MVLNGLPMVVNVKTNKVEVQHDLHAPNLTDKTKVHGEFRRVRYTAHGTYLVSFLEMDQIIEYDKHFKEIPPMKRMAKASELGAPVDGADFGLHAIQ